MGSRVARVAMGEIRCRVACGFARARASGSSSRLFVKGAPGLVGVGGPEVGRGRLWRLGP